MGRSRRSQFKKTRLCTRYLEGCCNLEWECSFAHSWSEIRPAADLTKTSMCQAWQRGKCPKPADECEYAHGSGDMRRKTLAFIRDMPQSNVSGQPDDMPLPRWCSDSFPAPPGDGGDGGCGGGVDAKEALGPHFKHAAAAGLGGEDEAKEAPPAREADEHAYPLSYVPLKVSRDIEILLITL
mmetsp:Transcript_94511/g.267499  ORF Transcript_94511/g.267499 Transcript_94511/m.267499 type:complete len:182 (-) Transcript_94511:141-686(-)